MANFVHDPAVRFLANQAIMEAKTAIARLQDFTTDYSADAAQPGSTMLVQFFDDTAAGQFRASATTSGDVTTPSNNYGNADGNVSFVPVKFSNHVKKSFGFTPTDYMNIGSNKFQQAGDAAGRSVSRALLETVVKLINPTNIPADSSVQDKITESDGTVLGTLKYFGAWNQIVAANTQKFDQEFVAEDLTTACDAADIATSDTVLLLNGKEYGQLLASLDAHVYGDRAAIAEGRIPSLFGFRAVVKVDNMTNYVGGNLRAALVPVNALGIAARTIPVLNAKMYDEVGTVTDDKSGLVIQFRRGGDWKTDSSILTAEALFGAKLLQPTKIVRIVSADPVAPTGETGETGPTA